MNAQVNAKVSNATAIVDLRAWFFDPDGCHTDREMILQESLEDYVAFVAVDMWTGVIVRATHSWMSGCKSITSVLQEQLHNYFQGDAA